MVPSGPRLDYGPADRQLHERAGPDPDFLDQQGERTVLQQVAEGIGPPQQPPPSTRTIVNWARQSPKRRLTFEAEQLGIGRELVPGQEPRGEIRPRRWVRPGEGVAGKGHP